MLCSRSNNTVFDNGWYTQTITKRNAEKRLEKVFSEWSTLTKSKDRKSDPGRRQFFTENLKKLWDVGSPNAIKLIRANCLLSDEQKENDIALYSGRQNERKATTRLWIKYFKPVCRRKALIACTNKHNDATTYDVYNRKKAHKSCVYYMSVLQEVRRHSKFYNSKFEILDSTFFLHSKF